jgi:hypothetical protein
MIQISHAVEGVLGERVGSANGNHQVVSGARRTPWARLAITWDMALDYLAPIGYEDETGFHYGEPAREEALSLAEQQAWPPGKGEPRAARGENLARRAPSV